MPGLAKALNEPALGIFVIDAQDVGVIGFIGGGKIRELTLPFHSELYAIHLLPNYRNRGLGHRVMEEFVKWLIQSNHNSMMLWVLKENQAARQFYENLGGRFLTISREATFGNTTATEIAYGWDNLKIFPRTLRSN